MFGYLRDASAKLAAIDKSDILVLAGNNALQVGCLKQSALWNYISDDPEEYINWDHLLLDKADNP